MQFGATQTSEIVFECLEAQRRPLGAYEILAAVRHHGINSAMTVYRALDRLRAAGRVRKIESLNAFMAVPADMETSDLHKILGVTICDQCGTVSPFWDDALAPLLAKDVHQFDIQSLTLELHGFCNDCRPPSGTGTEPESGIQNLENQVQ